MIISSINPLKGLVVHMHTKPTAQYVFWYAVFLKKMLLALYNIPACSKSKQYCSQSHVMAQCRFILKPVWKLFWHDPNDAGTTIIFNFISVLLYLAITFLKTGVGCCTKLLYGLLGYTAFDMWYLYYLKYVLFILSYICFNAVLNSHIGKSVPFAALNIKSIKERDFFLIRHRVW